MTNTYYYNKMDLSTLEQLTYLTLRIEYEHNDGAFIGMYDSNFF